MAEKKKEEQSWRDILRPLFQTLKVSNVSIPQTINESRRAAALLRSLPNKTQVSTYRYGSGKVESFSPVTNRQVVGGITRPTLDRKYPTSGVGFMGPQGIDNQAFSGGFKNAKLQGLLFQLGDVIQNLPPGGVQGYGSDQQRRNVYQRYGFGPQGEAYKRPDGRLQPRDDKGRLGKATDTAGRLKGGLTRMAAGNVVRQLAPAIAQRVNHPLAQAYLNVDDILRQITGEGITERTLGGTRDQLQQTIEKDKTVNFGPLLPF